MQLNQHKTGLALGALLGLWHLLWALLVAIGWAQPLMDFMFRIHFVQLSHSIAPFGFGRAVLLVFIAFVVGYIVGSVFAALWNWLHKGNL